MTPRIATGVELAFTVLFLALTAVAAVPLHRNYVVRTDLDGAVKQTVEMLQRAQHLSRQGKHFSSWGVHVGGQVLFRGYSFERRDLSQDIPAPLPPTVQVSGLLEIVFASGKGTPRAHGDILFTAINGWQRILRVQERGVAAMPEGSGDDA